MFDPLSPWDFVEKKTCFEANQAGFWSMSRYKKLTLNTKLFTGHTLPAFWSSSKTLASKVLICPETSFVLFYQKFDSTRVKRLHKNERKVREKDRNYKELLSLFSFVFFFFCPPPPPLHLPSINPAWFLFPYMCLRISKEKLESLWTGYQSLDMHRKQNFKLVFGFKNDLAVLTFLLPSSFTFLASLFFFCCASGFILVGKDI